MYIIQEIRAARREGKAEEAKEQLAKEDDREESELQLIITRASVQDLIDSPKVVEARIFLERDNGMLLSKFLSSFS